MSNNTSFYLVAFSSGGKEIHNICHDFHANLITAKEVLLIALDFELRYDLLLENYLDLETYVLGAAVESSVFPGRGGSLLPNVRHQINRRLSNLLSRARLYIDQTAHSLSKSSNLPISAAKNFRTRRNKKYDDDPEYRIMEALRNYSQHCGFPAQSITFGIHLDEREKDFPKNRHSVTFGILPEMLKKDSAFKPAVAKELEELSDKNGCVSAMPIVRRYLSCLAEIHSDLRKELAELFKISDERFSEAYEMARDRQGNAPYALYSVSEGRSHCDEQPLNKELISQRTDLENKTRLSGAFERRYVSSQQS